MISIIDNLRIKKKCQIFTPTDIVDRMLDSILANDDFIGKTILENSCGNGEFLVRIVERYIELAINKKVSPEQIRSGLEHDIVAVDVDNELIEICKLRLNQIAQKYGLSEIRWNVQCRDFLDIDVSNQYDYVVGNPPYIAYSDLPPNEREKLRGAFDSCKQGKFDYCYAFIEKSIEVLATGGKLAYIIPSNVFKNVFAQELRNMMREDIKAIIDYPEDRVFSDVLVSPAIIIVEKSGAFSDLQYTKVIGNTEQTIYISKERLYGKWFFDDVNLKGKRVGAYYKVSNSIATLRNNVFILKGGYIDSDYYCLGDDRIEMALLRKATSPKNKKHSSRNQEYIIFPYYYGLNNELLRYSEQELRARYPLAMQYLDKHRHELEMRDADVSAKWFEYGRSQALQNMNQKKVLISSVISQDTQAYLIEKDEIPYAGIYVISTGELALETLLESINSDFFKQYAACVGVSVSGASKRITTKDIENYVLQHGID